jgi:hypothetical protein
MKKWLEKIIHVLKNRVHHSDPPITLSTLPASVQRVDLVLQNRSGSVEHYYHFLLGYLIPLVEWYSLIAPRSDLRLCAQSCAIMDHLTLELNIPGLEIVPKESLSIAVNILPTCDSGQTQVIKLQGFDHSAHYCGQRMSKAAGTIHRMLAREVDKCRSEIFQNGDASPVVMIERCQPDQFYLSGAAEIPKSGSQRRSILNYADLVRALVSAGANVISVSLEGKSLAWQIALFQGADCIIAQHGAALANLVFCPPGTTLIEIMPRDLDARFHDKECFSNLSRELGIPHRILLQEGSHSAVDLEGLISAWSQTASCSKS